MAHKDSVVYSTEKVHDNTWERSLWKLTDKASVCLLLAAKGMIT